MAEGDFFAGLQQLVEEWHKAAEPANPSADYVELVMFLRRDETGDVELSLRSAKEWLASTSVRELVGLYGIDLSRRGPAPELPVVTRTIKKKE